jgi:hypothetical protein
MARRRSSSAVADEEEYESEETSRPRRGRARRSEQDSFDEGASEATASRRSRRSDEPEERGTVAKGWGGYKKNKKESGGFPDDFKVPENDEVLIKFLESEPFASYRQHWLKELNRKSYVCLGEDCPLCDELGDSPNATVVLFNVLDLTDPDNPEVKVWKATSNPTSEIERRAESSKTSPIDRPDLYFVVSKDKQKNGFFAYSVDPVKARDLEEDFDMAPFTEAELDEFLEKLYDESVVKLDSRRELRDIARDLLND